MTFRHRLLIAKIPGPCDINKFLIHVEVLAAKVTDIAHALDQIARLAAAQIATFLLDMGRRLPVDRDGVIDLPLSRQQVADILGITIETVSRQLTEMKRAGTIDLIGRRGVRLVDRQALEALAEAG